MSPIQRAIELAGGQARLAELLAEHGAKVTPQAVQQWQAQGTAPAKRVVAIAAAVGYRVTPHELAPALYPHPRDGLPRPRR